MDMSSARLSVATYFSRNIKDGRIHASVCVNSLWACGERCNQACVWAWIAHACKTFHIVRIVAPAPEPPSVCDNISMAYIRMVYIVVAFRDMVYMFMAVIGMVYIGMAYIGMACIGTVHTGMAYTYGVYSYGLYRYGLHS